jgi:hypothetical protein
MSGRSLCASYGSRAIGLAFFVAAFELAAIANAEDVLWQTTQAGMSVQQVLTAVPGSHQTPPESRGPGNKLKDGSELWVLGATQDIAGHPFVPNYFFIAGALSLVRLDLQGATKQAETEAAYDDVLKYLHGRFGKETSLRNGSMALGTITWHRGEFKQGSLVVGLSMYAIGERKQVLSVSFRATSGSSTVGSAP